MRENYIQTGTTGADRRRYIEGDWYHQGIPPGVETAGNVYIDTSYGFAAFCSLQPDGLFIDEASGCYDRSSFIVSEQGRVRVGKFSMLNGTTIICNESIVIGNYCMLSWGSVVTDTWLAPGSAVADRRALLENAAHDPLRRHPFPGPARAVVLEDNCWVGFGAVVMPGVRLGRGCIVGCKTIVTEDVPPYAVVAGSEARIVRLLDPDDTEAAKQEAMKACR